MSKHIIQKGFTLVEVMIAVAVIAILAAVALPSYQNYTIRSRVAECLALSSGTQLRVADEFTRTGNAAGVVTTPGSFNATDHCGDISVSPTGEIVMTTVDTGAGEDPVLQLTPTQTNGMLSWTCGLVSGAAKHVPGKCRDAALTSNLMAGTSPGGAGGGTPEGGWWTGGSSGGGASGGSSSGGGSSGGDSSGGGSSGGDGSGGDGSGGDGSGGDGSGGDGSGGDGSGGDNPGGDNPGGDNPGGDNPGGDNPGGDNPGGDNPGGDNPGGDIPGGDIPGGDSPPDLPPGRFNDYPSFSRNWCLLHPNPPRGCDQYF